MTSLKTRKFFSNGTANQFDWIFKHYEEALHLKAHHKSSKPENVIKLDKWFQNELPKKIKSRGKEAHMVHDELVQTIKWKLARGKYRPNLANLVRMNTPRVVMQETKKAFRKLAKNQDIQSAMSSLCTLKGVGPAMASAVLTAAAPELAPYMADEILWSLPDVESLDYTVREYMRLVEYVKEVVERLNNEVGNNINWNPHKVELAVWTHYIVNDLKPEILEDMPEASGTTNGSSSPVPKISSQNGIEEDNSMDAISTNGSDENGKNGDDESSKDAENGKDSSGEGCEPSTDSESTNDSAINNDDDDESSSRNNKRGLEKKTIEASNSTHLNQEKEKEEEEKEKEEEPSAKKIKNDSSSSSPPKAVL